MHKIIGYGEDALTYWAMTQKIEYILQKLEDKSNPSDCLLIYRPSFGRRGGLERANFGEFDAILATSYSIYLIESKWNVSSKIKNGRIKLREQEVLRHRIFAWYFKRWDANKFQSWSSFVKKYEREFKNMFDGKKIADSDSRLSRNLEYVIDQLHNYSKKIGNVLIFFDNEGTSSPTDIDADQEEVKLVIVNYQILDKEGYVEMGKSRIA